MEALAIDKYALFWHRNVFGRLSFSSQGPVAGLVLPAVLGLWVCGMEALNDLRTIKATGIVLGGDHLTVISIGVGRPVGAHGVNAIWIVAGQHDPVAVNLAHRAGQSIIRTAIADIAEVAGIEICELERLRNELIGIYSSGCAVRD